MKNKKLFAILTLVCFMMTLMPVAAFAATYAEVDADSEIVKLEQGVADVDLAITTTGSFYVYAVKDNGSLYTGLKGNVNGFVPVTVDNAKTPITVTFADAGEYTLYATPATNAIKEIVDNEETVRTKAQMLALVKDEAVTMLDNKVTVKPAKSDYELSFVDTETDENDNPYVAVKANSGYSEETVVVKLVNTADNDEPVVGATLKISTNSAAVDVDKTEVKTNAAGEAKFKVTASTAGTFKVYVEYGAKAEATLTVEADTLVPAKITTASEPKNPIALDETVANSDVTFTIADANGNAVTAQNALVSGKEGNYKVNVTTKPAGSSIDEDAITLSYNKANGVWILVGETFDEEGDYTIKVTLNNGNYAVAKVTVKEFQKPIELKMEYKQEAVELNGEAILNKLYYVDANGVKKSVLNKNAAGEITGITEVQVSANGYAVKAFDNNTGKVTVKADEKYVGSVINVLAVSNKYNLTAAVELAVANEASGVKYANTKADVAVNNTLTANVVDQDGKKVALNGTAGKYDIQYIVLDKPENSKVAISTLSETLAAKGQFKVSFTASEIGNYKVQTVVRYEQKGTVNEPVVKYYSGIETITVGNTGFEDIVVMSINSNEIVVNANKVAIDAAPIVKNDITFVPFRALAEAFGAEVAYDEATQAVTAELNGVKVVMTIGSATYTINGVEKTMDVAPFINGSRTMIPVRFAAEAFGITVTPTYDENGATADVLFAK